MYAYIAFEFSLVLVCLLVHDQIAGIAEGLLANFALIWLQDGE